MLHVKNILCATDFSPCATIAVEHAIDLARALGASVIMVHVLPDIATLYPWPDVPGMLGSIVDSARDQARVELRDLERRGEDVEVRTVLRDGKVDDGILATAADEKADLIVIGTHGRTGLKHVLLGSVAERIVRRSTVPVLTVRGNT